MLESIIQYLTFPNICIGVFFLATVAVSGISLLSILTTWVRRRRSEFLQTEGVYGTEECFPCLLKKNHEDRPKFTEPSVYLSVIVPAMNEEQRLPEMLDECIEYCESRMKKNREFSYEVIIVDDGSKDKTSEVGFSYGKRFNGRIKVLRLEGNRGKGGAVRVGVLHSSGKLILFADADGASKFSEIEKLENELIRSCGGELDITFPGLVIGSRSHLEAEAIASRSWHRTILMHGFHLLVWLFTVRSVKDTQCGFKMFTRAAAARLFPVLHIEKWAFDVELLFLAEKWNMSIKEVCITWEEKEGSKIVPIWSWLQMGRDLILIWFRYAVGIWTDKETL